MARHVSDFVPKPILMSDRPVPKLMAYRPGDECTLHYSVSKNGVLKLVLNRFVYSAEYSYRDGRRKWRCSNRCRSCRAFVVTKDNMVVRRSYHHTHPYQDKTIMRLMAAGSIVTALPSSENFQQEQLNAENPCE